MLSAVAPGTPEPSDGRGPWSSLRPAWLLWLRPVWDVVLLLPLAQLSWR